MSKYKYFPFAPNIPWKTEGDYLVPFLSASVFNRTIKDKNAVIVCYGGWIESYLSLYYLEMLNDLYPNVPRVWCGEKQFEYLLKWNGLAKKSETDIPAKTLLKYTTPIFLDKSDNVYFNCLNNYKHKKNYNGLCSIDSKDSGIKTIINNSTMPYNPKYLPKFRHMDCSIDLNAWARMNNIDLNKPYVLMVMDTSTSFYDHISFYERRHLYWLPEKFKIFSAMMEDANIPIITVTDTPNIYIGKTVVRAPYRIDFIISLVKNATTVLSADPDFTLLGLLTSKAIVCGIKSKNNYNIIKNRNFLNTNHKVCFSRSINPYNVYKKTMRSLGLEPNVALKPDDYFDYDEYFGRK